jgi:hypothetical protein
MLFRVSFCLLNKTSILTCVGIALATPQGMSLKSLKGINSLARGKILTCVGVALAKTQGIVTPDIECIYKA